MPFKRKYEGTAKKGQALHSGFAAAMGLVYSSFSRDASGSVRESPSSGAQSSQMYPFPNGFDAGEPHRKHSPDVTPHPPVE